jgi:hypothetical protein
MFGILVGGATMTSQIDIANAFKTHFTSCFRSQKYDPLLKLLKDNTQALLLNLTSQFVEPYSAPCGMGKLLTALEHCHNMSSDPNGVHTQLLSHLPKSKKFPLSMYNCI